MDKFKDIVMRRVEKVEKMLKRNKLPFFARRTMKMEKPKISRVSLLRFSKYKIDEKDLDSKITRRRKNK